MAETTTSSLYAHLPFVPRSIDDRAYWARLNSSLGSQPVVERVRSTCEGLPAKPPLPLATDFLAARRSNDRRRVDHHWRTGRQQLAALIVRRCLEGAGEQDDQLLDWLWSFLTEPTWVVSAHLPGNDLPRTDRPVLDLASCDMAAFMAEAREVLGPWMDAQSGTLADIVVAEIDRKVLVPFVEGPDPTWMNRAGGVNNWIGVCAGSILAACESLAAQGHPRPQARAKAIACLRRFFDEAFTTHGECDEGVSYWSYGVGMACLGLMRLSRDELSGAVDLDRMRQVADYPRRAHLIDDVFFSGNDAGLQARAPRYFVPWLAEALDLPWMGDWAAAYPGDEMWHVGQALRALDAASRRDAPGPATLAASPRSQYLEDQEVLIARHDAPGGGQMIVCLSGGHNGERHNHNDVGHFVVTLDRRIIVPDLGAPQYTADFFGPNRYRNFLTAASRGHCCPIVNGAEQRVGREAAARVLEKRLDPPKLSIDGTAAYPAEAGLARWTRTLDGTRITDEFRTRGPDATVTHVIWSLEEPSATNDANGATLAMGGLSCVLSPPPDDLAITPVDPADHLMRDFTDRTLYQIHATYRTDAKGALTVTTDLRAE